ncbi:MAG: extracellular solute-binding protein, partial [Lacisediminihabitans sp.]
MEINRKFKAVGAVVLAVGMSVAALSGCSSTSSTNTTKAKASYTFWDPYPQYDASSDWAKVINSCAADAGVTIKRSGFDTTDLTNKALLAGQQKNSPDILLIDNPVISTLAEAGILTTTAENKLV